MVTIVKHPNFGAEFGTALGSGLGEGLAALAEGKIKGMHQAKKIEETEAALASTYKDVPKEQLRLMAKEIVTNPKIAQEWAKTQFQIQKENAYEASERQRLGLGGPMDALRNAGIGSEGAQAGQAAVAGTGGAGQGAMVQQAPGEESPYGVKELQRVARTPEQSQRYAEMGQTERLAKEKAAATKTQHEQQREDTQYAQILHSNEPWRKTHTEELHQASAFRPIVEDLLKVLDEGEAASGAYGGIVPSRYTGAATQFLEALIAQAVTAEAQFKGGSKQSNQYRDLIAEGKVALKQKPEVQKKLALKMLDNIQRAENEELAYQGILNTNNNREINNIGGKVTSDAQKIGHNYKKFEDIFGPAWKEKVDQAVIDDETGMIAVKGASGRWEPYDEEKHKHLDLNLELGA